MGSQDSADWGDWVGQAEHLLAAARDNLERGWYDVAAVLSQQAAEMFAKAVWIAEKGEAPPRTHAVETLLSKLGSAAHLLDVAAELSDVYVGQRYPGAVGGPPFQLMTRELAERHVEAGEDISQWAKDRLPQQPPDAGEEATPK